MNTETYQLLQLGTENLTFIIPGPHSRNRRSWSSHCADGWYNNC